MSSRVQKGNTIFKPVAKAKSRTAAPSVSRQTSVILEHPSADFSNTQKPPSSSRRTEQNGPLFHPPLDVVPESAPLVASTANNIEHVPASRTLQNVVPTVISTPSRIVPPVVAQAAPQMSPLTAVQSPMPISLPASAERPFSTPISLQSAVTTQSPICPVLNAPSSSSSTPAIPVTQAAAPATSVHVQESFITEDRQEGSSKGRKRKRNGEDNAKGSRRRKTSKGSEPETTERERSKSQESRSRGSSKTRNRKRAPSPPPFDPGADPGEEIDPTAITMSALCADTGQGRISSKAAEIVNNHAAWKLKTREKRTRMRAIMEAKKYGRPDEEVDETGTSTQIQVSQTSTSDSAPAVVDITGSGFDYSQDLATSRYNVQVRIGPNGETLIDEDSLVVDRAENHGTENFTHVMESDYTRFVNSGTYGKRFRGSRWSAEETELFYDALSQYGENYELIAYVLPGRDRKACKNKFKAEDRKNPARISYCLNNSVPVDISTLSRMTGKDFSGPVPEIRAPPPQTVPPIPASEVEPQNSVPKDPEVSAKQMKKRSRSKSQGISDGDAVVIGDVDGFQSS